jgi:hypothetical protein
VEKKLVEKVGESKRGEKKVRELEKRGSESKMVVVRSGKEVGGKGR